MPVRTTVDIPEPVHDMLRHRARQSGASIRALIVRALEQTYGARKKDGYVTGPLVKGTIVATARKGLTGRHVTTSLPGGNLRIEWREADGHILMTGPWAMDYEGVFDFGEPALASASARTQAIGADT
jgi:diaminopimelate epimerase